MPMATEPALAPLNRLVGTWTTEITHPELPGVVARGTAVFEWFEGERFLIHRASTDHPDFPDAISIIGITDQDRVTDMPGDGTGPGAASRICMHYFDSRGVFRLYDAAIDDQAWRLWRDAARFSQRFTGTFTDSGHTIVGRWQLCLDDVQWRDDLEITYRRRGER